MTVGLVHPAREAGRDGQPASWFFVVRHGVRVDYVRAADRRTVEAWRARLLTRGAIAA